MPVPNLEAISVWCVLIHRPRENQTRVYSNFDLFDVFCSYWSLN